MRNEFDCMIMRVNNEWKKTNRDLSGLEAVTKKGILRWFEHVQHKDEADCTKHCMTMKADRTTALRRQQSFCSSARVIVTSDGRTPIDFLAVMASVKNQQQ